MFCQKKSRVFSSNKKNTKGQACLYYSFKTLAKVTLWHPTYHLHLDFSSQKEKIRELKYKKPLVPPHKNTSF